MVNGTSSHLSFLCDGYHLSALAAKCNMFTLSITIHHTEFTFQLKAFTDGKVDWIIQLLFILYM